MPRVAKLIMVTGKNNNKYYDMVENTDESITATWGRVDVTKTVTHYPAGKKKWDTLLKSKIKKGYKDVTHLRAEKTTKSVIIEISNKSTKNLIETLLRYANKAIEANYTISSDVVTEAQIRETQELLDNLALIVGKPIKLDTLNETLLNIYTVLPRKMKKVQHHLFAEGFSDNDIRQKINVEQDLLDVMAGQVKTGQIAKETGNTNKDILEANGLSVIPATQEEINYIKDKLGPDASRLRSVFQVINHKTQGKFDTFLEKTGNKHSRHFWHGSRNENWWSIMGAGLILRPTNAVVTGKMFGYGLYFADKARKSLGYTSLRGSYWARGSANTGYMSLYKVHLGTFLKIKNYQSWCGALTYDSLRKRGTYDSLFAEGGADLRNNEFIVYQSEQCTIRYIVELV